MQVKIALSAHLRRDPCYFDEVSPHGLLSPLSVVHGYVVSASYDTICGYFCQDASLFVSLNTCVIPSAYLSLRVLAELSVGTALTLPEVNQGALFLNRRKCAPVHNLILCDDTRCEVLRVEKFGYTLEVFRIGFGRP